MERLAIDGGTSVRTKPFPSNMLGAALQCAVAATGFGPSDKVVKAML